MIFLRTLIIINRFIIFNRLFCDYKPFLSKLRINDMQYVVKYKLFFHTFNKEIEDKIIVDNGLSYFNGEKNCSVYDEADAVDYVKATHKLGEIEKLFKVPQEIYDSEYGEVGATSLKILRCWIS